jgi:hypothetical protein
MAEAGDSLNSWVEKARRGAWQKLNAVCRLQNGDDHGLGRDRVGSRRIQIFGQWPDNSQSWIYMQAANVMHACPFRSAPAWPGCFRAEGPSKQTSLRPGSLPRPLENFALRRPTPCGTYETSL